MLLVKLRTCLGDVDSCDQGKGERNDEGVRREHDNEGAQR